MMQVTMFNVGYGDCFLLDVDGGKLIVDFGSKHEISSPKVVAQDLCNLIGVDS